jgi:nitrile hydratase accessory protein
MAVGLHRAGVFEWEDFRRRLIREIDAWEAERPDEAYPYYRLWLAALEGAVVDAGVAERAALDDRVEAIVARPAHDHRHH